MDFDCVFLAIQMYKLDLATYHGQRERHVEASAQVLPIKLEAIMLVNEKNQIEVAVGSSVLALAAVSSYAHFCPMNDPCWNFYPDLAVISDDGFFGTRECFLEADIDRVFQVVSFDRLAVFLTRIATRLVSVSCVHIWPAAGMYLSEHHIENRIEDFAIDEVVDVLV